jgi:hypothetical protein
MSVQQKLMFILDIWPVDYPNQVNFEQRKKKVSDFLSSALEYQLISLCMRLIFITAILNIYYLLESIIEKVSALN